MSECEQRLRWCQLKAVLKMNYIGSFKICQRMLSFIFATSYFIVKLRALK